MTTRIRLLAWAACAAAVLPACGSDAPSWAKRADQVDRARWAAVCGTKHDVFDDGGPEVEVAYSQESFDRPSPAQPEPRVPSSAAR